jgi:hypothetical protein
LCDCGCQQPTLLSTNTRGDSVRHQPLRFIAGHHNRGMHNPRYKGRTVSPGGYVYRFVPEHPHANKDGCVFEHRLVMEAHLGRYLRPEEVVHHLDHDRQRNDIDNLQLFANNGEHRHVGHASWSTRASGCTECGTTEKPHAARGLCNTCNMRLMRRAAGGRPGLRQRAR